MSGWTNLRVEIEEGVIDEASSDPQTREEATDKWFEGNDFRQIGDLAYQAPVRHWGVESRHADSGAHQVAEVFSALPWVRRMVVMYANDTSDSGSAYLYEPTENDVDEWELERDAELVDEYNGAGQARGYDAQEYMRDEHRISVSPSAYW